MATAIDVVKYIKSEMNLKGDVQLHKLLYYAQAWSLAWDGKPLFDETVEAWRMGPVVPAVRHRRIEADSTVLNANERATVKAIVAHYGRHHGQALAAVAHAETPWAEAWDKRPSVADWCDEEITLDAMRRFYTCLALRDDDVPSRLPSYEDAVEDEVREAAAITADKWRETLAILAR